MRWSQTSWLWIETLDLGCVFAPNLWTETRSGFFQHTPTPIHPQHYHSVLAAFTCPHHSWVNLAFQGSVSHPSPIEHTHNHTHSHTQTEEPRPLSALAYMPWIIVPTKNPLPRMPPSSQGRNRRPCPFFRLHTSAIWNCKQWTTFFSLVRLSLEEITWWLLMCFLNLSQKVCKEI